MSQRYWQIGKPISLNSEWPIECDLDTKNFGKHKRQTGQHSYGETGSKVRARNVDYPPVFRGFAFDFS